MESYNQIQAIPFGSSNNQIALVFRNSTESVFTTHCGLNEDNLLECFYVSDKQKEMDAFNDTSRYVAHNPPGIVRTKSYIPNCTEQDAKCLLGYILFISTHNGIFYANITSEATQPEIYIKRPKPDGSHPKTETAPFSAVFKSSKDEWSSYWLALKKSSDGKLNIMSTDDNLEYKDGDNPGPIAWDRSIIVSYEGKDLHAAEVGGAVYNNKLYIFYIHADNNKLGYVVIE